MGPKLWNSLPQALCDNVSIGLAARADFRRLYPANVQMPTCCPSDDNRTKVTNSVTSARPLWWHVGPYFWPADLTRTANPIYTLQEESEDYNFCVQPRTVNGWLECLKPSTRRSLQHKHMASCVGCQLGESASIWTQRSPRLVISRSLYTLSNAVSVLWFALYADWHGLSRQFAVRYSRSLVFTTGIPPPTVRHTPVLTSRQPTVPPVMFLNSYTNCFFFYLWPVVRLLA